MQEKNDRACCSHIKTPVEQGGIAVGQKGLQTFIHQAKQ
jgi:hypothetical protein